MSDGKHKINVTLKAGKDYDAPWITVGGDSAEEVVGLLGEIEQVALLAVAAGVGDEFGRAWLATHTLNAGHAPAPQNQPQQQYQPVQQQAPQGGGWGGNQGQQSAPTGQAPVCAHGPMTDRNFNGSKVYQAWYCTSPKGTPQCPKVNK